MKNNLVKIFAVVALMVLAIIGCTLLGVEEAATVIALPFSLLGKGLRLLSLTGNTGNIAAIILYILVCLMPLALGIKRKHKLEDLLLPLCSAIMFYVMYYMINPGLRPSVMINSTGDFILSCAVYSILLSWLIIKLLRNCDSMDSGSVYRALRIFMWVCIAGLAVAIVAQLSSSLSAIGELNADNGLFGLDLMSALGFATMPEADAVLTSVFMLLSSAVEILENGLIICLLFLTIGLVRELEADPYGEGCCHACENISEWCKRTLAIVTLSSMALNIAQILFMSTLLNMDVSVNLPIVSLTVAFGLLALSRLLNKGKLIKEDNELFV